MAFVLVAVFDKGRACFISKKNLYTHAVRREVLNGLELSKEWSIGLTYKPVSREKVSTKVVATRLRRARFEFVTEYGYSVTARIPEDKADRQIAVQIAKESGWILQGDRVEVSV